MGLFDRFKKKKVEQVFRNENAQQNEDKREVFYDNVKPGMTKEDAFVILNEEVENLFPTTGHWVSSCFKRPREVCKTYLPCHLRDESWLTKYFQESLNDKKIYIPSRFVKEFVETSPKFADARHKYELEIVKWQIDWMRNGGENWLIPEGFDDFSLLFSPDVDVMFRGGVVKTLSAIGMNREVIEEGIEKNAHLWRRLYMLKGFSNDFEQHVMFKGSPDPASKEFKENWLCMREYKYYQKHRESIDKYGRPTDYMLIGSAHAKELAHVLSRQEFERRAYLRSWAEHTPLKTPNYGIYGEDKKENKICDKCENCKQTAESVFDVEYEI